MASARTKSGVSERRRRELAEKARRRSRGQLEKARSLGRRNLLERRLERWRAELPPRFSGYDLEDDILQEAKLPDKAKRPLREFLQEPGGFLLLQGPTGIGKSTTACALVEALIRRSIETEEPVDGGHPLFRTTNTLLREFSDMDVSRSAYARALNASILVLDDIGAGNNGLTGHQERMFWALLKERDEWPSRTTIITTNMPLVGSDDPDTLEHWMGTALWDRIRASGTIVQYQGASLRHGED